MLRNYLLGNSTNLHTTFICTDSQSTAIFAPILARQRATAAYVDTGDIGEVTNDLHMMCMRKWTFSWALPMLSVCSHWPTCQKLATLPTLLHKLLLASAQSYWLNMPSIIRYGTHQQTPLHDCIGRVCVVLHFLALQLSENF